MTVQCWRSTATVERVKVVRGVNMAEFKSALKVQLLPECPNTERWLLLEPLVYQSDILGMVTVPANFITDFVSLKELNYTAHRPATVHDFLYSCKDVSREQADTVLEEALTCINEDPVLVKLMFLAVRTFGGSHRTDADLQYTLKGE